LVEKLGKVVDLIHEMGVIELLECHQQTLTVETLQKK
jgi:hypothetical protein